MNWSLDETFDRRVFILDVFKVMLWDPVKPLTNEVVFSIILPACKLDFLPCVEACGLAEAEWGARVHGAWRGAVDLDTGCNLTRSSPCV